MVFLLAGELKAEGRSPVAAFADAHLTAVSADDGLTDGQPDAHAAPVVRPEAVRLLDGPVQNMGQHRGRDARAVVLHGDRDAVFSRGGIQPDPGRPLRVGAHIVKQIDEYLLQQHPVRRDQQDVLRRFHLNGQRARHLVVF